jgi:hypothetical protein
MPCNILYSFLSLALIVFCLTIAHQRLDRADLNGIHEIKNHQSRDAVGLPGFQVIQYPMDYMEVSDRIQTADGERGASGGRRAQQA